MRVTVCAVGRMKAGPERSLFDDYWSRFGGIARGQGMTADSITEVDTRRVTSREDEAAKLRHKIDARAVLVCLDERGVVEGSDAFARRLAHWRDSGHPMLTFVIGGADGLSGDLRGQAHHLLSFGPMVWPHMLARVMLSEQLYRAASILAGTPYHRS